MTEEAVDLWPDLGSAKVRTPLAILKQQAALLGKHTNNLLEGQVTTQTFGGEFHHRFLIEATALDYRYELFVVSHGVKLYPVRLESGPHQAYYGSNKPKFDSEQAFVNWLKGVLNSEDTKRVLSSLLSQAES
ncbi:MAG: hypothetical protein LAP38_02975 [Acidobacteriia bacterium]|nr:hypothetical protein [Terriglobia bacterium]